MHPGDTVMKEWHDDAQISLPASGCTCCRDAAGRHGRGAEQTGRFRRVRPRQRLLAAPAVAEQADRLLKEMGAYIGSAEQFTFHADVTFDHVLPSGQKLQFSAAEEVALQRPGRLYVEWNGDLGARQFWYDGKSVTLYDPATPFYASEAATARDRQHAGHSWYRN